MSAFETDSRLRKKEKMYEKEVIFHINRITGNYIYPMGVNYGFMIQIVLK